MHVNHEEMFHQKQQCRVEIMGKISLVLSPMYTSQFSVSEFSSFRSETFSMTNVFADCGPLYPLIVAAYCNKSATTKPHVIFTRLLL